MRNWLINNNTVAILKNNNKTVLFDIDDVRIITRSINRVVKDNCNFYGSTLNGRVKSAQNILNIKYKVPLIIKDNLIFIPISPLRSKDSLYISVNSIIDYKELENNPDYIKIICLNNIVFKVKISKYSLEKMLLNAFKLTNILKWRK